MIAKEKTKKKKKKNDSNNFYGRTEYPSFTYGFVSICDWYKLAIECFRKVVSVQWNVNMLQKAFEECSLYRFSLIFRLKKISLVWIPISWFKVHWLSTPLTCLPNLQLQNVTTAILTISYCLHLHCYHISPPIYILF